MGIFLCPPMFFNALKKAFQKGGYTITEGVKELVSEENIIGIDMSGFFWADLDTRESMAQAEKIILKRLSKPEEDGYVSYYINRRFSIPISKYLVNTSLTPNMLTIISFLFSTIGAILFLPGKSFLTIIAGTIVQLSSIVDGCDGEVARLKLRVSPFGGWFDTILDRYADTVIVVGIVYGYFLNHQVIYVWLLGIFALLGFILISLSRKEYQIRYKKDPPITVLYKLSKRDCRLFGIFLGSIFLCPFEMLVLLGIFSHLVIFFNFIKENIN